MVFLVFYFKVLFYSTIPSCYRLCPMTLVIELLPKTKTGQSRRLNTCNYSDLKRIFGNSNILFHNRSVSIATIVTADMWLKIGLLNKILVTCVSICMYVTYCMWYNWGLQNVKNSNLDSLANIFESKFNLRPEGSAFSYGWTIPIDVIAFKYQKYCWIRQLKNV